MIEVKNLTMSYGKHEVLKNIDFHIKENSVVGLLGENGAGKSTTMNILTGYTKPVSGEVFINGINMIKEPNKAKKAIGYLPEIPPLYKDMKVIEYLEFAATLKKVKKPVEETARVMRMFDLSDYKYDYIKNLSKGWQQKVGFAQCMIDNPKVLILDEPLVDLDPTQSRSTRNIIKELAMDHTIIISSHILKELEELCNDILILKDGNIVMNDSVKAAKRRGRNNVYKLTLKGDKDVLLNMLENYSILSRVEFLKEQEDGVYQFGVETNQSRDVRDSLFGFLVGKKVSVYGIEKYENTLEDIFMEINSKEEK